MEPAKILFQASDDQRLVSAASQSTLNLFAHHKILGIKYVVSINSNERRQCSSAFCPVGISGINIVCTNSV